VPKIHSLQAEIKYYEYQKVSFDKYRRCVTIISDIGSLLSCRFQQRLLT